MGSRTFIKVPFQLLVAVTVRRCTNENEDVFKKVQNWPPFWHLIRPGLLNWHSQKNSFTGNIQKIFCQCSKYCSATTSSLVAWWPQGLVWCGGRQWKHHPAADVIPTSHDSTAAQNSMKATFRKSRGYWHQQCGRLDVEQTIILSSSNWNVFLL